MVMIAITERREDGQESHELIIIIWLTSRRPQERDARDRGERSWRLNPPQLIASIRVSRSDSVWKSKLLAVRLN